MLSSWTVRRPAAIVVAAALFLNGCTHYVPVSSAPRQALEQPGRARVRIVLAGGDRMEMEHPQVVGDSVRGTSPAPSHARATVSVALADISSVETSRVNVGLTVVVVVAIGVALVLVIGSQATLGGPWAR